MAENEHYAHKNRALYARFYAGIIRAGQVLPAGMEVTSPNSPDGKMGMPKAPLFYSTSSAKECRTTTVC
jgi:hypothetical protein